MLDCSLARLKKHTSALLTRFPEKNSLLLCCCCASVNAAKISQLVWNRCTTAPLAVKTEILNLNRFSEFSASKVTFCTCSTFSCEHDLARVACVGWLAQHCEPDFAPPASAPFVSN